MADESTPTPESEDTPPSATDRAALDSAAAWLNARPRLQMGAGVALIAATAFVAYYQLLFVPLHLDERALLEAIETGQPAPAADVSTLARIDLSLDARLSGDGAFGFRLASLMLHIVSGLLMFGVVWRILDARGRAPGWAVLAGLLFVAHPAGTQTVNTILSRPVGLATAGVLASLLLYLIGTDRRRDQPTYGILVLSIGFAALAWAAHPVAIVVPVLVLIVDLARRTTSPPAVHAAYWGLAIALALVALTTQSASLSLDGAAFAGHTLRLLIFPTTLLVHYGPEAAHTSALIWIGVAVVGLALAPFARALAFGLLWFAAATLGFALFASSPSFNEAIAYLALPAIAVPIAWGVAATPRVPAAALTAVVALLALAAIAGTSTRTNQWRSEAALWIDAQEACPACTRPNAILGRRHLEEAERLYADPATLQANEQLQQDARGHLNYALQFLAEVNDTRDTTPETLLAHVRALNYAGQSEAADALLAQTLLLYPDNGDVLLAEGDWYRQRAASSDDPAATVRAENAYAAHIMTADPAPRAVEFVASRRLGRGDALGALHAVQRARIDPLPDQLNRLAQTANAQHQSQRAARTVWAQAANDPTRATAAESIKARTLYLEGHAALTELVASDSLRQNPDNLEAWYTLGLAALGRNRFGEFIDRYAGNPPGEDPDRAWRGLAQTFVVSGQWDGARTAVEQIHPGQPLDMALELADVAMATQQIQQAVALLQRAAEEAPESTEPWLRLADIAIEAGQTDAALGFIDQAATRGAPDVLLQPLRERARGNDDADALGLERRRVVR